jgi:hypothetical protein
MCRSLRLTLGLSLAQAVLSMAVLAQSSRQNQHMRVPVIHQVGVIPVQWQVEDSTTTRLANLEALIAAEFTDLVRDAKRFHVLNPAIVADLWESPSARRQLADEYEMDAFVSLSVHQRADLQIWTARLLSPQLDNYLIEVDRPSHSWLEGATDQQVIQRLRKLTYRLLNRYPIDVFVTSVQGRFLTLSAGTKQNLFEGQDLTFHRFAVKAVHPANNSWLAYSTKELGQAEVIDAKPHTAIARLTSLAYPGAIRVGDGARVDNIASRKLFARLRADYQRQQQKLTARSPLQPPQPPQTPATREEQPQAPVPLPDEATSKPSAPVAEAESEPESAAEDTALSKPAPSAEQKGESEAEPSEMTESPQPDPPAELVDEDSPAEHGGFLSWLAQYLQQFQFRGGPDRWSYQQSEASADAEFPLWLINRFGGYGRLQWDADTFSEASAEAGFGPTKSGDFFRFGLGMNWFKRIPSPGPIIPSMEAIEVGLHSRLQSVSVTGESFGGLDVFDLGGFARIVGHQHFVQSTQTMAYRLGLDLSILAFGQAGLAGSKESISGQLTYGVNGELIWRDPGAAWELGGFLQTASGQYTTSNGSLRVSSLYFGVLARTTF